MSTVWTADETDIVREFMTLNPGCDLGHVAEIATSVFGRTITRKAVSDRLRRAGAPVATTPERVNSIAEVVLLIPDSHIPFQDRRALDVLHKAAALIRPTTIALMGDFADFVSVSFHPKNPNVHESLRSEVDAVKAELKRFDAYGAKRKVYVYGNHEYRLERYLAEKAPALFGVVDCDTLFDLKATGWESVPYRSHTKVGKLFLTHDTGVAGADAHRRSGATFEHSVVIGHTHRMATHYFGNATGETHVAAMLGWLGDRNQIDYMNPIKVYKDWQLGFGLAHVLPNGDTHLQAIPIVNYKAVVNGQVVEA